MPDGGRLLQHLGYQPSIAFESAGGFAPLSTIVLVLVTLFGALPVYAHVAQSSPHGQGSIAMLERLVRGWSGKTMVLALLGFAATDFVITKTLSAADAAEHCCTIPYGSYAPGFVHALSEDHQRIVLTMFLLVLLGATFMRGFKEVIGLAAIIVGTYLLLNMIVIVSGLVFVAAHPHKLTVWFSNMASGNWHSEGTPVRKHQLVGHSGLERAVFSQVGAGAQRLRDRGGRDAADSRRCRPTIRTGPRGGFGILASCC